MNSVMASIGIMALVAIVYVVAYKLGYNTAQRETRAALEEFSVPVKRLLVDLVGKKDDSTREPGDDCNQKGDK